MLQQMSITGNWVLGILLIIESVSDFKKKEVNLMATVLLFLVGIVRFAMIGNESEVFITKELSRIVVFLISVIPGMIILIISIITKGSIGMGDGIVVTGMGLWMPTEELLKVLIAGFFLSSIYAVFCCCVRKKGMRYEIPFIPFLLMGYIVGGVW